MSVIQKISHYLFISLMLISEIIVAYPAESVKWHPGYYYAINYGKYDTTDLLLYDELKKTPVIGHNSRCWERLVRARIYLV